MLVKSPNGFPVFNPYLSTANQAMKIRALLAEFGMTPGSRSRIQAIGTEDPANEWAKFLK